MRIKKELVPQKLSSLSNIEAEQCILGILLIDDGEREATEEIFTQLSVDDFYSNENKNIFLVAKQLFNKGVNIDIVSMIEAVERQLEPEQVNDTVQQLTNFTNIVPSVVNYAYYLKIIKDYSSLRKIENSCQLGLDLVKSGKNANSVSSILQEKLLEISEGEILNDCEQVSDCAEEAFDRMKKRANGEYDEFGLETGFPVLDKCLWGLQKSDLIIVAARAGVGKTAFALNVINHSAVNKKKKVAFFSLEMPKRQIIDRLYSLGLELPNYKIKTGQLESKFKDAENFKEKLKESGFFIDDDSNNTVQGMTLKAKRMQRRNGLDLVVVDYLQFIKPQERSGNRFQDVGEIARGLKSMARTLNVPVVALCQLNRQLDNDNREPTLADLRESGEIENNADIVMFLNSKSGRAAEIKDIDLIIGKHRNGQLKSIRMTYRGECFMFTEKDKLPAKKTEQMELTPIDEDSLPF